MKIADFFSSINGEVNGQHQGRVVTFLRTSGCNLKCSYCDAKNAQSYNDGTEVLVPELVSMFHEHKNKYICITGGEPLLQPEMDMLLNILKDDGFNISIETNGTEPITRFYRYVDSFVIDYKLEYPNLMLLSNYMNLRPSDVIKFVVHNIEEAMSCIPLIKEWQDRGTQAIIAFSPVHGKMDPKELANFLIHEKIPNSLISLQIHKIIGLK